MALAIVNSRASLGIDSPLVIVEIHLTKGIPSLSIVGLPEMAVKESKDRVRSAIINSGFEFPTRRITINLAPADLPKKDGGRFDLPIAIGILVSSKQLSIEDLDSYEFAGELALDGSLRGFNGVLPLTLAAKGLKHTLVLPRASVDEASLVGGVSILAVNHLLEIVAHFSGSRKIIPLVSNKITARNDSLDLREVHGQMQAKRALEIAAAGGHSLFMIGPPGVGKTMLANRLVTILPEMSEEEALESAVIYSVCGKNIIDAWGKRPFRAPHHTASSVALVGGANPPKPGEISLAHNGVLFLDELLEFKRATLEALREPLESKFISISRAAYQARFPAKFQLIVAMNPCPCGYFGDGSGRCSCNMDQIRQYRARVSGPFLDRIDLWVSMTALPQGALLSSKLGGESSETIRIRVTKARNYAKLCRGKINSELNTKEIENFCKLCDSDQSFLTAIMDRIKLSARSYHKILRIARTVADLSENEDIQSYHLKEAITYRNSG